VQYTDSHNFVTQGWPTSTQSRAPLFFKDSPKGRTCFTYIKKVEELN